ncbi:MAG: sigma 54-interacting transcriptional regulator [Thermodesulfobacteriota bacterium]
MIKERGRLVQYLPGDVMMAADDPGHCVRFIVSGRATVVYRKDGRGEISVESLGPGDFYGEIAALAGKGPLSDLELLADEPCDVTEVCADELNQAIIGQPSLALGLLKTLARKVDRLDHLVVQTKLNKRALKSLISREEHIFPDYVVGEYVKRHLARRVHQLADSDHPALLVGETGVGKEVLAHAIFKQSHTYKEVFLLFDLLRSSPDAESEEEAGTDADRDALRTREQMRVLFGGGRPDSEGIARDTPGYLQLTQDGTLLVRNAEHLTAAMQRALLDVVATGRFQVGGNEEIQEVRFRLIISTELDPTEVDPERHPLIHGLREYSLIIPPLRRRRREIPELVTQYIARHGRELRKEIPQVPNLTLKTLLNYSWPGNDVELSTTLKRAVLLSEGGVLRPEDISFDLARIEGQGKLNLLRFRPVRQAMLSPLFPAILQSAATPFFFILMVLFFLGPGEPTRNPASLFSWAVGWPALVLGSFLWGRFWCSICPMGTLGRLAKRVVALERPFPPVLKTYSEFLVAGAVLFIIWLETTTHMRSSPFNLGLLLGTITVLAVLTSIVFERQSWCRFLCPLGGMTGVLAQTAVVELRADRNVCASRCTSHECYIGNKDKEGCPFGQLAPTIRSNLTCKICAACLKNCPHGAINLNLRVPGQELLAMQNTNTATAFLIVSMLGALLSELVSQWPSYKEFVEAVGFPEVVTFTAVFTVLVIAVNALIVAGAVVSGRILGDSIRENYNRFALAWLPIALTAFFAFHVYYLINLGVQLPILLSRNFDLAIFRQLIITVPPWATFFVQKLVILVGVIWTLVLVYRFSRAAEERPTTALLGALPHALAVGVISWVVVHAIDTAHYLHRGQELLLP